MTKLELKAFLPVEGQAPEAMPDPFDLQSLALSQDFTETAGVKKLLRTIPVRKPNPQDFVRVHPDPEYRGNFWAVDLKDDRETFLVRPEIAPELAGELVTRTIYTAINRQGVLFLWPVPVATADGKQLEWWRSMREAYFELDSVGATEKKEMQEAIGADAWHGRYTREGILDYCESDVGARAFAHGHVAGDRLASRASACTLHGGRIRYGTHWHADRHGDARALAGRVGGYQGRVDCGDRR